MVSATAQDSISSQGSPRRGRIIVTVAADWGQGEYVSSRSNGSGWGFSSGIQWPVGPIDLVGFSDFTYLPFSPDTAGINALQLMMGGGRSLEFSGMELYLHALAGMASTASVGAVLDESHWGPVVAAHLGSRVHLSDRLSLDVYGNYRKIFGEADLSIVGVNAGIAYALNHYMQQTKGRAREGIAIASIHLQRYQPDKLVSTSYHCYRRVVACWKADSILIVYGRPSRSMPFRERILHIVVDSGPSFYKLMGESTLALSHFEKFHALQKEINSENTERCLRTFEILHRVDQYRNSLTQMEQKVEQITFELQEKTNEIAALAVRIMEKQEFVKLVEKGLNRILKAQPDGKDELTHRLLESIHKADTLQNDW